MKKIISLVLLLVLTTTAAWGDTQDVEFAGSTFQPETFQFDGRTFFKADDPEVQSLLGRANITAQWSSSGQTLFAFAPGRESYFVVGSSTATVNKQEITAPGLLIERAGERYIEPSALFYAMASKSAETSTGYVLYPVITEVSMSDTGYLLRSASKARPKVVKEGEITILKIKGFAWDGQSSEVIVSDTRFSFSGGADEGSALEVTITPPPYTIAQMAGSTLLNETKIDILPDFPGGEFASPVTLQDLEVQSSGGDSMLVFNFDAGAQMHYLNDEAAGLLHVFIPKGEAGIESFSDSQWPGLEISQWNTALYPVLQVTIPNSNKDGMELVQVKGEGKKLGILRGNRSQFKPLAYSGSIETPGLLNIKGTIVLDPGHGGSDPGCRSKHHGTREADITLKISKHLAKILRAQGWNVVMTRETDRDVTYPGSPDRMELEARSGIANKIGADLFVSIHCNASVGSHHRGSSIHWWKTEDYELAQSLEFVLGPTIGFAQKGLIRNRFVVLRHAKMPSVLVETAFLSNPIEGGMLSDSKTQKVIAKQLAGGLASYMRGSYASRKHKRAD